MAKATQSNTTVTAPLKAVAPSQVTDDTPTLSAIVAQWELIQRDVSKHMGLMQKQHDLVRSNRTRAVRVFAELSAHPDMQHRGKVNKSKVANLLGIERPTAYPYFEAVEYVAHMVELKAFTLDETPCEAEIIAANRPWDDAKALKREKREAENAGMGNDTGAGTSTKNSAKDSAGEGTGRSLSPQMGALSFDDILTKAKELHTTVTMAMGNDVAISEDNEAQLGMLMAEVMAIVGEIAAK